MTARRRVILDAGLALAALLLAACSSLPDTRPAPGTSAVQPTALPTRPAAGTPLPQATFSPTRPAPTSSPPRPTQAPTQGPAVEERLIEVEWPPQMRLGDSDLVRLSLIPSAEGYAITTEFADHLTVTDTVAVARPGGFDLAAVARLDAAGFDYTPAGEQVLGLPLDEPVTWRWTLTPRSAGRHRLSVSLMLRWVPQAGSSGFVRETQIYSKGLEVQVLSFFGLTAKQATGAGLAGLALGSTLSLPLAAYLLGPRRRTLRSVSPNAALSIEQPPAIRLAEAEARLLRGLFRRYARVVLEAEFRSGYSGARTFLILPVRADGGADAHTIAKIGERGAIQREFENYETFVKDTLPPITARIQETPVVLPGGRGGGLPADGRAALRYTFIGEPGRPPISLREALLASRESDLLEKLFSTFGPNWWMQRRPYPFRLAQEYDGMLPAHYVLEPLKQKPERAAAVLDGRAPPPAPGPGVGDVVSVHNLAVVERRPDGRSLSLAGRQVPGHPPLRVRWLGLSAPSGAARVVATRETMLRDLVRGFDLFGLPDPLDRLGALLDESVMGTRSTLHGDLNLENVLVGPGGFVWLIDFAQTREGHALFDFAHLAAQIVAHIAAPQAKTPARYLASLDGGLLPHLAALRAIAGRCLFNPALPREYDLALCLACLGALKHSNLDAGQRHLLYLTAAHVMRSL